MKPQSCAWLAEAEEEVRRSRHIISVLLIDEPP